MSVAQVDSTANCNNIQSKAKPPPTMTSTNDVVINGEVTSWSDIGSIIGSGNVSSGNTDSIVEDTIMDGNNMGNDHHQLESYKGVVDSSNGVVINGEAKSWSDIAVGCKWW